MFNDDVKYSFEKYYDENIDPVQQQQQQLLTYQKTDDLIFMNAIQNFFSHLDEINRRVSFYMLSKSKIYACYKITDQKCLLKIVDNSKLTESNSTPILYEKKLKMNYVCDYAFGDFIAILLETNSALKEKYCLQIYNNKLDLVASKQFSYEINPVYMNDKELFCLSIYSPVQVFDLRLNPKDLFESTLKLNNPNPYECFKHRAFWICGATEDFLYIDNRNFGFDIVCRKTGYIIKTIANNSRQILPCARIDSGARIIMINDLEKLATVFDQNGFKLFENSLNNIHSSLEEHYIFSTKEDDFYLLKQNNEITELNFFKTKQID